HAGWRDTAGDRTGSHDRIVALSNHANAEKESDLIERSAHIDRNHAAEYDCKQYGTCPLHTFKPCRQPVEQRGYRCADHIDEQHTDDDRANDRQEYDWHHGFHYFRHLDLLECQNDIPCQETGDDSADEPCVRFRSLKAAVGCDIAADYARRKPRPVSETVGDIPCQYRHHECKRGAPDRFDLLPE